MTNANYNDESLQDSRQGNFNAENLSADEDLVMEHILENINTTPIGQILKKIAALPEVSQQKILRVRSELNQGRYDINKRLDAALDKVLEDLIK
jgi:hypothetical protein